MWDRYDPRDDERDRGNAWDRSLGGRGSTSDRNWNDERGPRDVFNADGVPWRDRSMGLYLQGVVCLGQGSSQLRVLTTRFVTKLLLICTRGTCPPDKPTPMPDSVVSIPKSNVHSQKPEEFRRISERLYPVGKRLELFGRR